MKFNPKVRSSSRKFDIFEKKEKHYLKKIK
jgi:hypothetical protein